jgi:hypothetical protein
VGGNGIEHWTLINQANTAAAVPGFGQLPQKKLVFVDWLKCADSLPCSLVTVIYALDVDFIAAKLSLTYTILISVEAI